MYTHTHLYVRIWYWTIAIHRFLFSFPFSLCIIYIRSFYLFKSVGAQRDNVSNIATVSIHDERQSTPWTTMDHLGVVTGWIIELPINYGKKFRDRETRNFSRAKHLVKDIIARMETRLTFTCRRDVTCRKLRIGRMMRAEVVICIIISPGCYSRSRCNDNAMAYRFTM